jgi:hypothetical protein
LQVVCGGGIKWFLGVASTCGRCADVFEIFEGFISKWWERKWEWNIGEKKRKEELKKNKK